MSESVYKTWGPYRRRVWSAADSAHAKQADHRHSPHLITAKGLVCLPKSKNIEQANVVGAVWFGTFYSTCVYTYYVSGPLGEFGLAVLAKPPTLWATQSSPRDTLYSTLNEKEPNSADDICLSLLDILTL